MKKEFIFGLVALILIIGSVFYLNQNFVKKQQMQTEPDQSSGETMMDKQITAQEIATHNTPDNCWMIVNNEVYDLSNFAQKHPGGAKAIEFNCGKDGSTAFETRGDKGPHPDEARTKLEQFKIGVLSK